MMGLKKRKIELQNREYIIGPDSPMAQDIKVTYKGKELKNVLALIMIGDLFQ